MIGVFFHLKILELKELVDQGIPVVRLEAEAKMGGDVCVDEVCIDNFQAAKDLTEYLIQKGHRKIAMLSGSHGPKSVRLNGYCEALKRLDLTPIIELDEAFTEKCGQRAMRRLLSRDERPTAVIGANDLMAIGAMQAAFEQNLRVPDDIAIAGFDNNQAAHLMVPGLTTVCQFQNELGMTAAQLVIARLNRTLVGPRQTKEQTYQIIQRASA